MKKIIALLIVLSSFNAFADTKQMTVVCEALVDGKTIKSEIEFIKVTKSNSYRARIFIDGKEASYFENCSFDISLLKRSFRGVNNHGDVIDGKLTKITEPLQAKMHELSFPEYGIFGHDVSASCKWGKTNMLRPAAVKAWAKCPEIDDEN